MRGRIERAKSEEVIDLAAISDFTLGGLLVQPSLRKACAGESEELVEPRVMQALVALAQAEGAVVSRDTLIDRCWEGRIVGDDAINRCIAKVRRLADATQPPAFVVETVSKVGYLLRPRDRRSPAQAASNPSPPLAPDTGDAYPGRLAGPAASPTPPWRPFWIVLGLSLMILAAAGLARIRPSERWTVQTSRKLQLGSPHETSPRISPDGTMLAFAASEQEGHGRIYVRSLQDGLPVAVSSPDENAGSPAWAPDGKQLAYAVTDRQTAHCRIMVATFPGGTPRQAGSCRHSPTTQIAWQPATRWLFFQDEPPPLFFDTIFRVDIETGAQEQVTFPGYSETDFSPRMSPDGKWLAYVRSHGLQSEMLRLRELATGKERAIDCEPNIGSIDWTADGQTLVASVPGPMGDGIIAYPIDGGRSYRVYASASGLGGLATGPHGMLAVEVGEGHTVLARARTTQHASADIVDPSLGMTGWPAFAPDGTLAFVSSRSGGIALWTRKPGGQPVEIVHAGLNDIHRPVWSPDGTRIAFVEVWKGDITVHVVTAQGTQIVSFAIPSIGYGMPNWTPDGEHLVTFDMRILQVVRIDLRSPDRREPVGEPVWDGLTYHNGAAFAHHGLEAGIWQMNGDPRLITAKYPAARRARLAFAGNDILVPTAGESGDLQILAQPITGGRDHVAFYAPAAEPGTPLAVDPLTGDVLYVSEIAVDSHIDLLTLSKQ